MKTHFGEPVAAVYDRRKFHSNRKIALPTLVAFLVVNSICSAQIQQAWVAKYNNGITNGTHQAVKMALDTNGSVYITGFSQNTNGNLGYATIKYAPNGNPLWAARYDSTNFPSAKPAGLAVDTNNNVFVTGSAVTVKYDSNGNQSWTAPYAGTSLALADNSNVVVTGFGSNFNTVKLSSAGSNVWLATYVDLAGPTWTSVVSVDRGGNLFLCGNDNYVNYHGLQDYCLRTVKMDANGHQLWAASQSTVSQGTDQVAGGAVDNDGNFYVEWNNYAPSGGVYNTTKYAGSNGTLVWQAYDPTGDYSSSARGLAFDSANNVFVTGQNAHYYPNSSYGTYKINTNGTYAWNNNYPAIPASVNVGTSIATDPWNNVYVTGYSPGTNSGNDIVTIKYDNNGNQIWLQRYNGPGNGDDEANAIAVDAGGNVYVTGYETVSGGGTEMVTIKYAPGPFVKKEANGGFLLQAAGSAGQSFDIQASTNLQSWQDLGATNADTNGNVQFLDTNAPLFSHRFYLATPQ